MKGQAMLRSIVSSARLNLCVIAVQMISGLATGNYLTFLDGPERVFAWMMIASTCVLLAWNAWDRLTLAAGMIRTAQESTSELKRQAAAAAAAGEVLSRASLSPRYIGPPPGTHITEETALVLHRTVTWTGPQRVFAEQGAVWAQGSPVMSSGLCGKCREPMRLHVYYGREACRLYQGIPCASCGYPVPVTALRYIGGESVLPGGRVLCGPCTPLCCQQG